MIQFSNVKPLHSYNLTNNGIPHQFAFGQITVNVELSSVTRINGILIDAIKKLAGLQSHKDAVIQVEPKTDSLINNKLLIKEPTIASSQIIDRFFKFVFESKKPAQTFARFNKKHNLNSYGIFPAIKSNASEEFLISNNREDIITHDGLAFSFAVTNPINLKVEDRKILQHDLQTIRATPLIQTYFNNVERLSDQELLWFITNILSYKTARKELNKMKKRNARIAYYYKLALDMYPEPLSYKKIIGDNKFPYEYLYQAINSPIIPTMRIAENIGAVTQAEISVLLKEAQERFIYGEDKGAVLLRTDTGSGKTSTIKDLFSPNMAYVAPTHKLIEQFMNDVKKVHSSLDIVYIPPITDADIPECKHKEVMKYHERRGEYDKVRELRDKAIREHGTLAQKQLLNKYKEALKKENGTPFITHSRLINNGLGFFNSTKFQDIDTIIIDEDVLPALFPSSVELDLYVIKAIESVMGLVTTDLNSAGFGIDEMKQIKTRASEKYSRL